MKKLVLVLVTWMGGFLAYAADVASPLLLDTVVFQVAAKQWVSTQRALLTLNINVTLNHADLVKARADILSRLVKIAPGDWHLTQFDRSQDSSGLEKLYVQAQVRVDQRLLTNVYDHAKSVSKPGASYDIGSIEFKPSLEDMQQARSELRARLYQQAYDEVTRLNKIYAPQKYSLNSLIFVEGDDLVGSQPKVTQARAGMINTLAVQSSTPSFSVSNELIMAAIVQVASNRVQGG